MRLHDITLREFTRPPEMEDAIPILTKAGWIPVGSGYYGEVFSHPKTSYVLKLFDYRDRAYLDFLTLVRNNPNPHFPTLIGKPVKITQKYWAVRMEKLKPVKTDIIFSTYFINRRGKINQRNEYQVQAAAKTLPFVESHPKLKKALDLIFEILLPRYSDDLHADNVMQREDGTLVIIDPVAF